MNKSIVLLSLVLASNGTISSFAQDAEHYVNTIRFNRDSLQGAYISNNHDPFIYASDNLGATYPFDSTGLGHLIIQPRTSSDKDIILATGVGTPAPRLVVKATGKVGIGTTAPSSQLDVHGVLELNNTSFISSHTSISNLVTFIGVNSYWNGGSYATPNPNTSGLSMELHNGGQALRLLQIPAGGGLPMASTEIGFGGTNTFFNALGGNVGIGTTTPGDYKLAVNGSIRAKEVVVEASPWPDFVFDDAYRLKSLGEVENHISEHGRLPDVPSAAQVASDGLSLGEAQRIMMQKIEELTLYMIEKDKQVAALQAEVSALREWRTLQQASAPIAP